MCLLLLLLPGIKLAETGLIHLSPNLSSPVCHKQSTRVVPLSPKINQPRTEYVVYYICGTRYVVYFICGLFFMEGVVSFQGCLT